MSNLGAPGPQQPVAQPEHECCGAETLCRGPSTLDGVMAQWQWPWPWHDGMIQTRSSGPCVMSCSTRSSCPSESRLLVRNNDGRRPWPSGPTKSSTIAASSAYKVAFAQRLACHGAVHWPARPRVPSLACTSTCGRGGGQMVACDSNPILDM